MRNTLMEAAFNNANEGIIITDEQQCILEVNETVYLMTGFSREELLGKKVAFLSIGEKQELFSQISDELAQHGRWQGTVKSRHKDGHTVQASFQIKQMEFQSQKFFIGHISLSDNSSLSPIDLSINSSVVSASTGYTLYPDDNDSLDTLIHHAEQGMLKAKMYGKGKYYRYDANGAVQVSEKNQQRRDLETAIEQDQLELFFQPKIRLSTGKIFGFEALIRWRHPELGLLTPDKFIDAIYDNALEISLGQWVIQRGLEILSQWQQRGWCYQLSINLSAGHLCCHSFCSQIERLSREYSNVDLSCLQIEILESNRLSDLTLVSKVIHKLRAHFGISTALDDFGTGYSSLTHIRNLPVSLVKIDQLFVRQMLVNPEDCKIVEGVIALAQSFNVAVLAEGVESIKHGEILLAMGCDLAQGYAIAKPMPMELIEQFLKTFRGIAEWSRMRGLGTQGRSTQLSLFYHYVCYWLEQLEASINNEHTIGSSPLITNPHLCHSGIWLKRAKQQQLFEADTLAALSGWHSELHRQAQPLIQLQKQGKIAESRRRYITLQPALADIVEKIQSIID